MTVCHVFDCYWTDSPDAFNALEIVVNLAMSKMTAKIKKGLRDVSESGQVLIGQSLLSYES